MVNLTINGLPLECHLYIVMLNQPPLPLGHDPQQVLALHSQIVQRCGGEKIESYCYSMNGMAVKLNAQEKSRMEGDVCVDCIEPNAFLHLRTNETPQLLNLTNDDNEDLIQEKGEDIVIGMIDSGINPIHSSFNDSDYTPLTGWNGRAHNGITNNKIVGARHFYKGLTGNSPFPITAYVGLQNEQDNAKDVNGHGTHTAGIAGGNKTSTISGIAPRARLSIYKIAWTNDDGNVFISTIDIVSAFDHCILDRVDVINFSIGGPNELLYDSLKLAMFMANKAGITVCCAAGNDRKVENVAPWVITVGATTKNQLDEADFYSGKGPKSGLNIIKPDIISPGTDILSASLLNNNIYLTGTSMATPHIAGLIARLKNKYPTLNPSELKSILMTTAYPEDGNFLKNGAGSVHVSNALRSGLSFPIKSNEYLGWLIEKGLIIFGMMDVEPEYNLNVPSLYIQNGVSSLKRTVKCIVNKAKYTVSNDVNGMVVEPSVFTLKEGQEQILNITFNRVGNSRNGHITLTEKYSDCEVEGGSTECCCYKPIQRISVHLD